tara:strand:+ start:104 stop:1234 length:1131 start_codon:yes stop_codon:yes gene_type:complete
MNQYKEPVNFIDLSAQQKIIKPEIEKAILKVLNHGQYIMGPEVKEFENLLCNFIGVKNSISCANGTDALSLVLMAWSIGPNDAVFVPSFTYVATAEAPAQLGAVPFFVDVCRETFNISSESFKQAIIDAKAMDLNLAAVIPVDLFGLPVNLDEIKEIAENENIKILVDAAQSFGAEINNRRVGSMGDATTTSFFPAKPLGCYGDGGAVFTNDDILAEKVNSLRLHGKGDYKYDNVNIGLNSRLDTIQAAILIEKLKIFPNELKLRQLIANRYKDGINNKDVLPVVDTKSKSAWAQYTVKVKNRDGFQSTLKDLNIPTVIYYPIPLSLQKGYDKFPKVSSGTKVSESLAKEVISLPMYPYLSEENQNKIIDEVNKII